MIDFTDIPEEDAEAALSLDSEARADAANCVRGMSNFGAVAALKIMTTRKTSGFRPEAIERQLRHAAAEITRTILVCNVARPVGYQHRDLSTLEEFQPSSERCRAIVDFPHRWGFTISVLVRHKNLKINAKSEFLRLSGPVLFSDAMEFISAEHRRLLHTVPAELIVNTGWIASPAGRQLASEQDLAIYESMGAFELIAPWQVPEFEKLGVEVEVIK